MCKDVSYEMSEATQINLDMQGRDWRIKHGYEDPDNEYCVRCEQYIPHFEQAVVEGAASPLYCEQCNEDGLYSVSFETWERRIGKSLSSSLMKKQSSKPMRKERNTHDSITGHSAQCYMSASLDGIPSTPR